MSAPVVVSRIQNRRGTQSQFVALYPIGYTGVGGFGSGSYSPPYTLANYPNVLMPGELALCTDSRNIFIGNLNGEYIQVSVQEAQGLSLTPLVISLPPASTPTVIPQLTYPATPFTSILYSVADAASFNPNMVGNNYSKNGELQITGVVPFSPPPPNPPFPTPTPVTLTDVATEINLLQPNSINFMAQYDALPWPTSNIEILYTNTTPYTLVFSTASIKWLTL
jgi:hypothetical protein